MKTDTLFEKFLNFTFIKYGVLKMFASAILFIFLLILKDRTGLAFYSHLSWVPGIYFACTALLQMVYAWIINPLKTYIKH